MEWLLLFMGGVGTAIAPGAIAGGVIGGIVGNRSDAGMMKAWDATAGLLRRGDRAVNETVGAIGAEGVAVGADGVGAGLFGGVAKRRIRRRFFGGCNER